MTMMLVSKKYWFLGTDKKENLKEPNELEKNRVIEAISRLIHSTSA